MPLLFYFIGWVLINLSILKAQTIEKRDTIFLHDLARPVIIKLHPYSLMHTLHSNIPPDSIDSQETTLYFFNPSPDTLFLSYLYLDMPLTNQLPFSSQKKISDTTHVQAMKDSSNTFTVPQNGYENLFSDSKLEKSGVLARGITVGTNRDMAVNSTFRLQLQGDLGDSLFITAGLTDENIPIQPAGNTTQLSDFDRVFIQLQHRNKKLTLGDLELVKKETRFANYYRNGLGVQADYHNQAKSLQIQTFYTAAKGKFHTMSFQGEEAKQGPYRLSGKNNERFVIVLAGSEKVFVNAKLLTRGVHYIIEYNSGELFFTSQFPINSTHRIVVDYEYVERYYGRSFSGFSAQIKPTDKLLFRWSTAREADNPNAPTDFQLSTNDRRILQNAGDNPDSAFSFGADSTSWRKGAILYLKKDTTLFGNYFPEIFEYSNDSTRAYYQVQFVFVGNQKGYYNLQNATINGNVFVFVGIDEQQKPLGSYMPYKLIPIPKAKTVHDLQIQYQLNEHIVIHSEIATSNFDKNRLSNKNDKDNRDLASLFSLQFKNLKMGAFSLQNTSQFRYVGSRYDNIDRINPIEYGREWNFNDQAEQQTEKIFENQLTIQNKHYTFTHNVGTRIVNQFYGIKNQVQLTATDSAFLSGNYQFYWAKTNEAQLASEWIRHNGKIYKNFNKFKLGSELWIENKQNNSFTLSKQGSFYFHDFKPFFQYKNDKFSTEIYYNFRKEQEFYKSEWRTKNFAYAYGNLTTFQPNELFSIQNNFNYRNFKLTDTTYYELGLQNQVTLTNNFQLAYATPKKWLMNNAFYELMTEKIPRRQMIFVEVTPGLGEYEWIDFNGNAVQELNEFQVSTNPITANYLRYFLPTIQLYPAITHRFQLQNKIEPRTLIDPKTQGVPNFFRQMLIVTNLRVEQKLAPENDLLKNYLPNFRNTNDTTTLQSALSFKQDVVFWRNNKKGEIKFSYLQNNNKQFLQTGQELNSLHAIQSQQRWNFYKKLSIENLVKYQTKSYQSPLFEDRNFVIYEWDVQPVLVVPMKASLRWSAGVEYKNKKLHNFRLPQTPVFTNIYKIITDAKTNIAGRNTLNLKIEYWNIRLKGEPSATARFELLESLQPGNNLVINLFLSWFLNKTLELNVVYDGRMNKTIPPIHSGRVQLRAIL